MKDIGTVLLLFTLIGLGAGLAGAAMYTPILAVRYLFLRVTGNSSAEAVKTITQWKLFPDETPSVKLPPKPVYSAPVSTQVYSAPASKPVKAAKPATLNVKGATVAKGVSQPKLGYIHADENLGSRYLSQFKALGYNVTHSRTVGLAGATDEDNLAFAYGERRVIISFDVDMLILHHKKLPHCGIIRLPQGISPEAVVELYRSHWG